MLELEVAEFCEVEAVVSLVVGVVVWPAEPGAAALLLMLEELLLGLVLLAMPDELVLGLVVELLVLGFVLVAEPEVLPVVDCAELPVIEVSLCGVEGEVVDALPCPVAQLEETMLALSTLMVSPLAVPVTERVWPT